MRFCITDQRQENENFCTKHFNMTTHTQCCVITIHCLPMSALTVRTSIQCLWISTLTVSTRNHCLTFAQHLLSVCVAFQKCLCIAPAMSVHTLRLCPYEEGGNVCRK